MCDLALTHSIYVVPRRHLAFVLLPQFQFQILCLVIGVLSIVSVKKQKKLSLSMFERRKQQGAAVVSRSNPITGSNKRNDEEDIEFTPMTNQQRERVPLVARMEII